MDGIGAYSCACNEGYSGTGTKSCRDIDECAGNPCAPGGTCKDAVNDYACTCTGGFKARDGHSCPLKDNGDGTITDAAASILWQKEVTEWVETPMEYCAQLTLKGTGWRLPTPAEVDQTVELWPDPPLCIATDAGYCRYNYSTAVRGPDTRSPSVVRCVR